MRILTALAAAVLLAAGRGERVPRDYLNSPPSAMRPPTSSTQTPTAHGLPGPGPEPSTGAEGQNVSGKPVSTTPAPKLKDQAPANDTQHATQTGGRAATGTHLAVRP
jgi:hypothetical protein